MTNNNEPYDWAEELGVNGDAVAGNADSKAEAKDGAKAEAKDGDVEDAAIEPEILEDEDGEGEAAGAAGEAEGAGAAGNSDAADAADAAADAADGNPDDIPVSADDVTAIAEAAEWKDKYMRLHAEWDTYRRRQKEQAEQQKALASAKVVESLIPVVDDLERSIDYAKENGETGLLSGVEAVLTKFVDVLKKDGVEVIDPKGEAFDALEAQAVGTVDDPSVPDETVADVYQKGYKIGTKVIRPAMVTVTTGGPARPKEED